MARPEHPIHGLLAGLVADARTTRVLDLGCGTGGTLAAVAALAPGARLHGVDRNEESLLEARRLLDSLRCDSELTTVDLDGPLPMASSALPSRRR